MFSKKLAVTALVVSGLAVFVSSCKRDKKDDNIINDETTAYAEEQLMLEQIYANADRIVDRAILLGEGSLKGGENPLGGCATIKTDTTDDSTVHVMTINFGGGKCLGFDGRSRSGKLIVYHKQGLSINDPGYYRKTIFDAYVVDGHRVSGYRTMSYEGKNPAGNHYHDIASVDTIYLPNGSGKVTGVSERQREWYKGSSTLQTADDVYRITGSGYFFGPHKDEYHLEIVKPLADAFDCSWINEGVTNIFPEGASQRVLDYGAGDCDNDAVINVNGVKRIAKIP